MAHKDYQLDLCNGFILGKLFKFALPVMASGLLQLLFNATDMVVVGRFASANDLAAVGSTSSFCCLLLAMVWGLASGANVLIANAFGAKNWDKASKSTHTALLLGTMVGTVIMLTGWFIARKVLSFMGTPQEVLDKSCIYMYFYCACIPFIAIYEMASAAMRAFGDTRRPLFFLICTGILNIFLNLLFVIVFRMAVVGVALATLLCQIMGVCLALNALYHERNACRVELGKLHIDTGIIWPMMAIALPSALHSSMFNLSNMLVQSSINSFGAACMAGNTAASSLEGIVYMIGSAAFFQTSASFAGQNSGAGKYLRIRRYVLISSICSIVVCTTLGLCIVLNGSFFLGLFNKTPEIIEYGIQRLWWLVPLYGLCGTMDCISGTSRGMGYATMPMILSFCCICMFRAGWIFTVFQSHHTIGWLMASYPISWLLNSIVNGVYLYFILRRKISQSRLL